jgi:7,8-dihydropterin-6-yl-methyl-4-(beta-D-ribofuranosyl)aminobenzene 5'-phosphate synthase
MKVTVLVENTIDKSSSKSVASEHGLSLYIEFAGKKILFDVGHSNLLIKNAIKLGIDLAKVDYVFISHGHSDHGGGLKYFFDINKTAKVYIHQLALKNHYAKIFGWIPFYVGLDQHVMKANKERLMLIEKDLILSDEMIILEGYSSFFPQPEANKQLYEKSDKQYAPDSFRHEIVLLLKESDGAVLFTGCSHSGIVNMVTSVMQRYENIKLKAIFGGFHTYNPMNRKSESNDYVGMIADQLSEIDATYYTGHCTGKSSFLRMKEKLGEKIKPMNTGEIIEV